MHSLFSLQLPLLVFVSFQLFGQGDSFPPPPEVEVIYIVLTHVPQFPGCEHLGNKQEKEKCANDELLKFIYENLTYPKAALRQRREGTAIIRLYVEKNGKLSGGEILENPGSGMVEEALRVVNLLKTKGRWSPGPSYTRNVRFMFQLPVEFKLAKDIPLSDRPPLVPVRSTSFAGQASCTWRYKFGGSFELGQEVSQIPLFAGCDTTQSFARQVACSDEVLRAFFQAHFRHPTAEVSMEAPGDFRVNFVVDKKGNAHSIWVDRDPGGGVAAEAIRVTRLMNEEFRWQPARKNGKAYRVDVSIPLCISEKRALKPLLVIPPPPPMPAKYPGIIVPADSLAEPPLFPGCEDLGTYAEKRVCAEAKMQEFLQGNLRYPRKAEKRGVEGTVLASYVVEKNGSVSNAKIIYEPGVGTGKETLRLIDLMNEKGLKFSPGKSGGRSVRVRYLLELEFRLP